LVNVSVWSCPPPAGKAKPMLSWPSFRAIILDGSSAGSVEAFTATGQGSCYRIPQPELAAAEEILSVPWTPVGQSVAGAGGPAPYTWTIAYRAPECAAVFDSPGIYYRGTTSGQPYLYIDVELPLNPPTSCTAQITRTTTFGPEAVPLFRVGHPPVGLAKGPEL
jgi:hypothetical protein